MTTDWLDDSAFDPRGDEEWELPIPFEVPMAGPPVPLDAFPREIGDYIAEISKVHQVAPDLAALAGLGMLGLAAGRRAAVRIGMTHTEPLNLYVMPTAYPGERKAQVVREFLFPFQEEELRLKEEAEDGIIAAKQDRAIGEKRIKHLQEKAAKLEDPAERKEISREAAALTKELPVVPAVPRLFLDDATPEYVVQALAQQKGRIGIVSEEAGSLFAVMAGRYSHGESNLDVYLKGYDGGQLRVGRIGREGRSVDKPALSIIVTPQPTVLDAIAARPDFRGRGLVGRFLFVFPESLVGEREYRGQEIAQGVRDEYARALRGLFRLPVPEGPLPLLRLVENSEALEVWRQEHDAIERAQAEGGELAGIRDWASKQPGRVARIAGLFHLVRHVGLGVPWEEPICAEDVTRACEVGEWLLGHALVAYERMGEDPEVEMAKRILDWIVRGERESFTLRDLYQDIRTSRPKDLLTPLEILAERGFVRREAAPKKSGRGRPPSPKYLVNPSEKRAKAGERSRRFSPQNYPHKPHKSESIEEKGIFVGSVGRSKPIKPEKGLAAGNGGVGWRCLDLAPVEEGTLWVSEEEAEKRRWQVRRDARVVAETGDAERARGWIEAFQRGELPLEGRDGGEE